MHLTSVMSSTDECDHCTWKNKLHTRMQYPTDSLAGIFQDVIMWRPAVSVVPNFLKGCPMHNNYLRSEFSKWKGIVRFPLLLKDPLKEVVWAKPEATA